MTRKPRRTLHPPLVALTGLALLGAVVWIVLPLAREGRLALFEARKLAEAVSSGMVRTEFENHVTSLKGMKALQFATLKQEETFRQSDTRRLLWNRLELPEVVVEITVPVEYTYRVSLDRPWGFRLLKARVLLVEVPPIEAGTPAPDLSALRFEVVKGSLLRDEEAVLERLRSRVTGLLESHAQEQIPLVRDLGRTKAVEFVRTWLSDRYDDVEDYAIEIRFEGELGPARP